MKIHLKFGDQLIAATLADTQAAHAFIAMLPITITMHDIFGREKFGALSQSVGHAEPCSQRCEIGDLICWSAGPDLAVLYGQDDLPLCGGFHLLGRLDGGADAFDVPGPLDVTISLESPRRDFAVRAESFSEMKKAF